MKKGNYVDEKLIRLQDFYQRRTSSYDLMTDEVPIRGKMVRFAPFPLFEGKVNALIPEDFVEMPEKIAMARYICSYRPPILLTSAGYDENFGFHLLRREEIREHGNLDGLICQMQDTVRLHAPETVFYGKGNICPKGAEGKWFEYKNFTLDDETYNLQFLISSDIYLLAGTFNCRMCFYDEWKEPVLNSLEYIGIGWKVERTNEG
ncbi:hypothetical protein [Lacrimispora sp.]|uniref:hypothetical protein n=1 Tax=Lacrimispora sp. TaxID=2719234 RepID=UPI0028AAA97D|nr:hypothetical protein [Lacrimispora sp.]